MILAPSTDEGSANSPRTRASLIIDHMLPQSDGSYIAIVGCPKYRCSDRWRDVALVELPADIVDLLEGYPHPAQLGPNHHAWVNCVLRHALPAICPSTWGDVGISVIDWRECDYDGGRPSRSHRVEIMQAPSLLHPRWVAAFEEATLRANIPESTAAPGRGRTRLPAKASRDQRLARRSARHLMRSW